MIWAFGIITLVYLCLMLFLLYGFGKVPETGAETGKATISFSIIVPFRNEAENLPSLLASFKILNYPGSMFQILLVDDHSEDTSVEVCKEFMNQSPNLQVKLVKAIPKSSAPKKDALETGIREAEMDFILTTDADCLVPQDWLLAFSRFIVLTSSDMVAGPVRIQEGGGFLAGFQEIDFFSLQAATIGGFGMRKAFMCNGANLAFRKSLFLKLGGYSGNETIASGDDVFLLEKFDTAGLKTAFLKDPAAIVVTRPQPGWRNLFMQRIRWAAKTSAYKKPFSKILGVSVFLMNLLLVVGLLFWGFGFDLKQHVLLALFVKFNTDFVLIYRSAHFFGRENSMKKYFLSSALYPFFCCAVVIASGFSGFHWKDRYFRK